jgi:hypothetical protein
VRGHAREGGGGMSAPKAVGVVLVGAAIVGVLVSLRYLMLAYLLRDRELAVMAVCVLGVYGFATLLLVIGGIL